MGTYLVFRPLRESKMLQFRDKELPPTPHGNEDYRSPISNLSALISLTKAFPPLLYSFRGWTSAK